MKINVLLCSVYNGDHKIWHKLIYNYKHIIIDEIYCFVQNKKQIPTSESSEHAILRFQV